MFTPFNIGLSVAVLGIVALSVYTGTGKKKSLTALNTPLVTGLILGTLVGGSSTIGTAQMAYNYGLSACWFTFGGALGCLALALVYAKPLRAKQPKTLIGAIADEYGENVGVTATVLNAFGTFINVFAQLLAASAVIDVVIHGISTYEAILIAATTMLLYVIFGGTRGAGIVGLLKLFLISLAMVSCGLIACYLMNQAGGVLNTFFKVSAESGRNFLDPFCRGFGLDAGAGLSLILGVLTTQTYAQAILAARSDKAAVTGALVSSVVMTAIGLLGIFVGLYMRTVTDPSVFVAKTALTAFISDYSGLSPALAGLFLGALFITSVGTGAGLALGIATMIEKDILAKPLRSMPKLKPCVNKILIAVILFVATTLGLSSLGDSIFKFSFLSMGLRGCTVFAPLCFALWASGKVHARWAMRSIIAGSLTTLALGVLNLTGTITLPFDAVFIGILIGLGIMTLGYKLSR